MNSTNRARVRKAMEVLIPATRLRMLESAVNGALSVEGSQVKDGDDGWFVGRVSCPTNDDEELARYITIDLIEGARVFGKYVGSKLASGSFRVVGPYDTDTSVEWRIRWREHPEAEVTE